MSDDDSVCTICLEPKSKHVATPAGPFTHPREASGEGFYQYDNGGTSYHGLTCLLCCGPCDGHEWATFKFVPRVAAELSAKGGAS